MTKTVAIAVSDGIAKAVLVETIFWGINIDGSCVSNFEFG